ncbi:MAG: formylglycine-generating enzyme family protein [Treponema sp.]|nr:formylglycine-generating enzyme family protein [Treponema sp.]
MKRFVRIGLILGAAMLLGFAGCTVNVNNPEPITPKSYAVGISEGIENGSVSADRQTAQKGQTVTLTLTANAGYKFGSISVKDASNNSVQTTTVTAGTKYTFVMPESNVTVSASFTPEGITGSEVFIAGRNISIRPTLWACDHEVTQDEYQTVMGTNPSSFSSSPAVGETQGKRPVEMVSWYACLVYCNKRSIAEGLTPCYTIGGKTNPNEWGAVPTSSDSTWDAATCNFDANGYRLPTVAEWEYLARGGNMTNSGQTTYSGSVTIEDVAWYRENSGDKTHEVKKKSPNALGLYDMSGNVWEWCWDWYGSITVDTPSVGASSGGSYRVERGGSWSNGASNCRVAGRDSHNPSYSASRLGFRVVRSSSE